MANELRKISTEELKEILENHKVWVETGGKSGVKANLSGVDLSKENLYSADLHKVNLSKANLYSADLHKANLYSAYLSKANLSRANLSGVDLSKANLSGVDLSKANLSGAKLTRAYLVNTTLSGANLSKANLSGVKTSRANLHNANLSKANLSDANLYNANLSKANLSDANLYNTNLSKADLSKVVSERAAFERADLYNANLSKANLSDANLYNANLSRAKLSRANLSKANLSEANLSDTNLSKANLSEANLSKADLRSSNFTSCNLTGFRFNSHTIFIDTNFEDCICEWAILDEKRVEFEPGEFENIYGSQLTIEMHFPEGLSIIEVASLPALINQLGNKYPQYNFSISEIVKSAGGKNVVIQLMKSNSEVESATSEELQKYSNTSIEEIQKHSQEVAEELRETVEILKNSQDEIRFLERINQEYKDLIGNNMGNTYNVNGVGNIVGANNKTGDISIENININSTTISKLEEELPKVIKVLQESEENMEIEEGIVKKLLNLVKEEAVEELKSFLPKVKVFDKITDIALKISPTLTNLLSKLV